MDNVNPNEKSQGADAKSGETGCEGGGHAIEHLHEAEHDLEKALEKQRDAAQEIAKAEVEIKEAIREEEQEHARQFAVEVLYDGVKKKFEVRIEETVKQLLDKAIAAFGPLPNPHTLSLYKDGKELADTSTIKQAGIKPHDVLLLRPSTVKGGA
jgi:predicted transcriptional regulator